ncbi:hypothetical protein LCGC14_1258500 [marine sediment metagenome]|uniref:DUF4236 domain-containing protein n=1 Tax=marine sediment metagenome TaxID=412755 RepID=A0A0F9L3W5_9ZZZZ
MGFRFFRRMNIAPGVRLNFSKSGISPSFGVRGARVTLGRTGVRTTVGIPGTGLFYTEVAGSGRGRSRKRTRPPTAGGGVGGAWGRTPGGIRPRWPMTSLPNSARHWAP